MKIIAIIILLLSPLLANASGYSLGFLNHTGTKLELTINDNPSNRYPINTSGFRIHTILLHTVCAQNPTRCKLDFSQNEKSYGYILIESESMHLVLLHQKPGHIIRVGHKNGQIISVTIQ